MKQLSLIEWIENTEQTAIIKDCFKTLAAWIGDLAIEKNVWKYIQACSTLQQYINAGKHPEDALWDTCVDLDI